MKLIILVGVPGSGKSSYAKEIAKKERATIVSSDGIREELFGDESIQGKPYIVFKRLYEKVDELIAQDISVIIDATNIKRDKRMAVLEKYKQAYKECYYFDTTLEMCLERDNARKRTVGERVIDRFYKSLEVPLIGEGFDKINIIHSKSEYPINKEDFIELVSKCPEYEVLYETLKDVNVFSNVYRLNQENPYHKYLLCEHIYNSYAYINEFYNEEDKLLLQIVALLHDVGKPMCKKFKETKGYCTYYGHDLTSAQIACHFLKELDFDDEFIMKVISIIEMHMFIVFGGPEAAPKIYHLIGEDLLSRLYVFKDADNFAK